MKDIFSHLTKASLLTATLPATVMMDVVTMGGSLVGKSTPFTMTQLLDIKDSMTKATKQD
jgi:hypothetical protein